MPNRYPERVKQRALVLAPMCSSAANVRKALEKEFPIDQVPANDKTIWRWLKEQNIRYLKNIDEHFTQLTDIARLILEDDVGKVLTIAREPDESERKYTVVSDASGVTEIPHSGLIGRIEGNIDYYVCQHYSTWHMWDCFAAHLEAEYPESEDFNKFLYNQTSKLINALRTLAERKEFEGSCPICKKWH